MTKHTAHRALKALGLVNLNSYSSTERIGVMGRNIVAIAVIVDRSVICFIRLLV